MKVRAKPLALPLLLLLPSLAAGLEPRDSDAASFTALKSRRDLSREAPVDRKDGKPHLGPFVATDGTATDSNNNKLPPLDGLPDDPTMLHGQKIPKSNDGVMFDKNRERPQKGTTGTEGGVSEKERARKAKEGETGVKFLAKPQSPKEQPPLPHSEEQKLRTGDAKDKDKSKQSTDTSRSRDDGKADYTGLDVRGLHHDP